MCDGVTSLQARAFVMRSTDDFSNPDGRASSAEMLQTHTSSRFAPQSNTATDPHPKPLIRRQLLLRRMISVPEPCTFANLLRPRPTSYRTLRFLQRACWNTTTNCCPSFPVRHLTPTPPYSSQEDIVASQSEGENAASARGAPPSPPSKTHARNPPLVVVLHSALTKSSLGRKPSMSCMPLLTAAPRHHQIRRRSGIFRMHVYL